MGITSLNISLPKSLKDHVERQVKTGGYSTPSEYLRALLREDQKLKAEEKLEMLLLEGLASGKPISANAAYWRRKRRKAERHKKSIR
jgi:antitoxin ParD1/3/4